MSQHKEKIMGEERLVVRVGQDSDSDLQALFDSVLKPDAKRPLQVPLRMRKLPNSFFNPPQVGSKSSSVSHSHENSADSAFGSGVVSSIMSNTPASKLQASNQRNIGGGGVHSGALSISHSRAHSSPATLQQTQQAAPQHTHFKQRSYDVVGGGNSADELLGPLPPGWEQARTSQGQIYYLNHITKTTTWEDPRKTIGVTGPLHQSTEQLLARNSLNNQISQVSTSKGSSNDLLGLLPDGVEQAQTAEGEIYFINHHTRTTSWFDPRIPAQLQRNPALNAMLPQLFVNTSLPQYAHAQDEQTAARLQSLKMEREMLKQRQHEINLRQHKLMTSTPDPFVSGTALSEHQRHESTDSGLGMAAFHLPSSSDHFLQHLNDNMDCVSETGTTGLDSNLVSDVIDNTDDLVPSLQLGEDFSNDILNDVQSLINTNMAKTDNVLTWL